MEFIPAVQNGFDELKPSLFELLSEQQLSSLLPPSLRYLLAVATHKYPRYLLRVLNSFDELYALVMLIVERHFLRTYGGGFTENFYGLKRERVLHIKGQEVPRTQLGAPNDIRVALKLREVDIWRNLAIMVGLPYLKRKLDESYDIHAAHVALLGSNLGREQELIHSAPLRKRLLFYYKWFLRNVYPSINAAYHFSLLAFNLAYLFDGSKYHSPFLWLVGTRMRRLGGADHQAIALATKSQVQPIRGARPGEGGSIFNPRTLARNIYPSLLSSFKIILPTSIFVLKFLEWWHASDFAHQLSRKAAESIELPPPTMSILDMKHTQRDSSSYIATASKSSLDMKSKHTNPPLSASTLLPIFTVPSLSSDQSHLCPICLSSVTNATATPTGYTYCYSCIHKWVEGSHERQIAFIEGSDAEGWGADEGSREGKWESGKGRCAVSGRKLLGGVEALRRIVV